MQILVTPARPSPVPAPFVDCLYVAAEDVSPRLPAPLPSAPAPVRLPTELEWQWQHRVEQYGAHQRTIVVLGVRLGR